MDGTGGDDDGVSDTSGRERDSSSNCGMSDGLEMAVVSGDPAQEFSVALSSCLGWNRDSGDDETSLETLTSETPAFSGSAGLEHRIIIVIQCLLFPVRTPRKIFYSKNIC